MAAHRALTAAVVAATLGLAACQAPQLVPPVLVTAFQGPPSVEAFERLVATVRAHGYEVHGRDVERGTFYVISRYSDRTVGIGSHSITVQLYADGHARVAASGPRVEPAEGGDRMPIALRRELVVLAQILER